MIKKILSVMLCTVILSITLVRDVKAVDAVVVPIGLIIAGILGGLGVTTINDTSLEDFNNFSTVEKNIFMEKFYSSLSTDVQNEITEKAKLVTPGEMLTFNMSTKAIKEIFFQIYNNVIAEDDSVSFGDSRDFKFETNRFMTSMSGSLIETGNTKVAYFPQFYWDVINGIPFELWNSMGVIHSMTRFYDRDLRFVTWESLGFSLVNCIALGPSAVANYENTPAVGIFSKSAFDRMKEFECKDKTIGEFTNSAGKKIRLSYDLGYNLMKDGSDNWIMYNFEIRIDGKKVFSGAGNANSFDSCYAHGISHENYFMLYFFKDNTGKYYVDFDKGSSNGSPSCTTLGVVGSYSLDVYDDFAPVLVKDFAFTVSTDEPIAAIEEKVRNLDDDKDILINIPITKDGAIALPTDKSEIMDMTEAGAGTVEKPDIDIDIPDLDIPKIFTKFPFSIPYDIYNVFFVLSAAPVTPKWTVPIVDAEIEIDFSQFDSIARVVRWVFYLFFVYGLIQKTRTLIKG